MADEKRIREAKVVYDSFRKYMDGMDFHYQVQLEEPERMYILKFGVSGDDIPMQFHALIDVKRGIIKVVSPQPVRFEAEKRAEAALALCKINDSIVDGSYSMDLEDGTVLFNETTCFMGSLLSDEVFHYLIGVSSFTVDEYNEKLLMLQTGMMDLETFINNA